MDEAYVAIVRRLAEKRDPEIISNSSIEHAAVLIGEMFRCGSRQANIFSGSLKPALYARDEILNSIGSFLAFKEAKIRILLQDIDAGTNHAHIFLNQIETRLGSAVISSIEIKEAGEFAKRQTFHFATIGDSAFRFESDQTKHEAFASFGQPEQVKKLNHVFDTFWAKAGATISRPPHEGRH
jgi:hypothetical protein